MARKRSHGEGSLRKLKSGNWHGEIMDGRDENGKKIIVSFSAKTKAEVLDLIRDYQNKKDAHVRINKKKTLSEWGDLWYEDYQSQVQASTYCGYQYTLKLIKERLGGMPLCDVLPLHINRFQDSLVEDGYSLSQIRKCRTMLIQIFNSADSNGLILKNPATGSKIIRDKDGSLSVPKLLKDTFDDIEQQILHNELPHDLLGNSIRVLLDSGIRVQELLALEPRDIAEDGSEIDINKAIKTVAGKSVLGPPKSKQSKRKVPVPERSRAAAKFLREHGGHPLVWSLPGQNPCYSVGSFRRRYYSALKKIEGVRLLSPHNCRHTYVTQLQAKGVSLELIAKLAGHSSISTTDGYAHTSMETLKNAVAMLNGKEAS